MSSASEETILVQRVFLCVGNADTDEQFETVLAKFLCPVLLKLASPNEGVRKNVMELLVHINKRAKSRPQVKLPVESLLMQYKDPELTSFVINFTIIYLKMGFPRLSVEKQVELVPKILLSLEGKPQTHQDSLLLMIIPLLGKITVPTDPAKRATLFGLNEKPQICKHLLTLLLDMLLLPYGFLPLPQKPNENEPLVAVPQGMSEYTFKRVTQDFPLKAEELEQIKLGIVKFLANEIFPKEDVLLQLIVAAADTRFSVANLADNELKKVVGAIDWTKSSTVMPLYLLFLGTQTQNTKSNLKKTPASTRIRLKLLTYLCRVSGTGFVLPPAIQIIFDSLYGVNTNTRLKTLALNFTINLVQYAEEDKLSKVANVLKSGMIKLTNEGESTHQGQAFVIIGMISRRFPAVVYHDTSLLEMFYKKLEEADTDLKLQIREGVLNVISAFKHETTEKSSSEDDETRLIVLLTLLKHYIQSEEPMVRFAVVKSLATFFQPDHVASKFLLLLATGDGKDDVANEAMKSLYGTARKQEVNLGSERKHGEAKVVLPAFKEIIKCVYEESTKKENVKSTTNNALVFPAKIFIEILIYARLCLIQSVNIAQTREIIKHPSEETPILRKYLRKLYECEEKESLVQYLKLSKQLLDANQSFEPICLILEVVGCVPELYSLLDINLDKIRSLLTSTKEETREYAASLYAVLLNEATDVEFIEAIQVLLAQSANKNLEAQHGALLALGYCLERRLMRGFKNEDLLRSVLETLVTFLSNTNNLLCSAACISLGNIAKCCPLPLENGESKGNTSPDAKRPLKCTKYSIVRLLQDIISSTKLSIKCKERAAKTLGLLCIGEHFLFTKDVMEGFLNTIKDTKDVEVHFTIGESLVMCVQSVCSPEARDAWKVSAKEFEAPKGEGIDEKNLEWLIGELLKYAVEVHPNSKQAASVWLLALLNNCIEHEAVKSRFGILQNVFLDLLGENNDIVQDVASKALCLIYDYSKSEELLAALVEQLTYGRRQAIQVSSDTKVFEEGQLGKSPTGGNLSTYKELCSLASELNKPDLIYQFMHLANHNAIWNSKKGAAFGFSSIAAKCGEHLNQYLPNIIPKLYRYQYDPSPNLQASMQNIWHVLIPESQKMLDIHHEAILKELLANLNSNQYRVRQSCCLALQDFLKGAGNRSIHDSVDFMDELWSKLFRVMDDHHEQTRLAANKTARVLSKLCIRGCDVSQGKNGAKMIEAILPILLNTGITNVVSEVRLISLQTISELVKSAEKQLKPFLGKLIPALIVATGELESAKLSYLSTMFGAQSNVQEAVDDARASLAKSHFTTDTITKCLQFADSSILEELVPKVTELMKSSVGLGTRVVCAHFIALLTVQLGQDLQPYTGKLLAALVNGLTDRNSSIRKHYATAIGQLVRTAKDSSLEKLFSKIEHWYFEREDDSIRSACALTIQSIGNYNQEILKNYSDLVLPLVFFAMHEQKTPETQNTLEVWNEIWADQSPGSETGIRQNIENICKILKTALESPSWTMKAQAANAVSTVASKLGSTMESKHRNALIRILLDGLVGRTWSGKDKLLKALASICSNCKEGIKSDPEIDCTVILDAVLRESRKEEVAYKISSLEALGEVILSMELDRFEDVYNITQAILSKEEKGGHEDTDEDSQSEESRNKSLLLKQTVYDLLGKAWPTTEETQDKYSLLFVEHCVKTLPVTTRSIQVSILSALCKYVDKLVLLSKDIQSGEDKGRLKCIVDNLLTAIRYSLGIAKHTRLRKEALNVIYSLAKSLKDKEDKSYFEQVSATFSEFLPEISKDHQPEIKSRVIDLKNIFGC